MQCQLLGSLGTRAIPLSVPEDAPGAITLPGYKFRLPVKSEKDSQSPIITLDEQSHSLCESLTSSETLLVW